MEGLPVKIQGYLFTELIESTQTADDAHIELVEEVYSSPTVDREAGVIKGVKLLGRNSRNGREYTDRALAESAVLAEGARVYIDHDRSGSERKNSDFFAQVKDVRTSEDGNYGDLHFLKSHPKAEPIIERTERMPGTFGLSPHQFGPTRRAGRKQIVESVSRMKSIDIVETPATTNSIFESQEPNTMTLRPFVESIPHGTTYRDTLLALIEQDGMEEVAVDAPTDSEATPEDQVKAAFRAMVIAAFDDDNLDTTATIERIKEILKSQEKLQAKPTPEPDDSAEEQDAGDENESETVESLREENARLKAENSCRELLESAGVSSSVVRLKALQALTDTERNELVESWKGDNVATTKSKPIGSPPKHSVSGGAFPDSHGDFLASITSR